MNIAGTTLLARIAQQSASSSWDFPAGGTRRICLILWPGGQGRLKVISSRARCHASQCEHSPDVVAQFLLARVN